MAPVRGLPPAFRCADGLVLRAALARKTFGVTEGDASFLDPSFLAPERAGVAAVDCLPQHPPERIMNRRLSLQSLLGLSLMSVCHEVRQRHRLAQLLASPARRHRHPHRLQAGPAAHRIPLRPLRRPPGACLRRRAAADRQALLQQRRGPAVRAARQRAAGAAHLRRHGLGIRLRSLARASLPTYAVGVTDLIPRTVSGQHRLPCASHSLPERTPRPPAPPASFG